MCMLLPPSFFPGLQLNQWQQKNVDHLIVVGVIRTPESIKAHQPQRGIQHDSIAT